MAECLPTSSWAQQYSAQCTGSRTERQKPRLSCGHNFKTSLHRSIGETCRDTGTPMGLACCWLFPHKGYSCPIWLLQPKPAMTYQQHMASASMCSGPSHLQEREGKDAAKSELDRLKAENRRLERQKGELLGLLRKQGRLVDVLRRQRAHMEAARALAFTEEDFMRLLEMGEGA